MYREGTILMQKRLLSGRLPFLIYHVTDKIWQWFHFRMIAAFILDEWDGTKSHELSIKSEVIDIFLRVPMEQLTFLYLTDYFLP